MCNSGTVFLVPNIGDSCVETGYQMNKLFAILLCVLFPISAFAGDNGYKIIYDGGSLSNGKAGTDMKLYIDGANVRIMNGKTEIAVIPAAAVTEIS
jgi:hypothetical protein